MDLRLKFISKCISDSIEVKSKILKDLNLQTEIINAAECILDAIRNKRRIFFAGNGGSAADAQHLAAEFISKFEFDRPGLPALALTTDTSTLTAIGNDYGYEHLFSRQLQAQSVPGDVFMGITTSGSSKNVVKALDACHDLGVKSIVLCGLGGDSLNSYDFVIRAPSNSTARIQESHILIGHILCSYVESHMFASQK